MPMIELSRRLQAVADLVTPGSRLADVGCDHGYLSIYLVQSKKVPHSIAMDVNRGPLLRAQEHICQYGLEEYIETRPVSYTHLDVYKRQALIRCATLLSGEVIMRISLPEPMWYMSLSITVEVMKVAVAP